MASVLQALSVSLRNIVVSFVPYAYVRFPPLLAPHLRRTSLLEVSAGRRVFQLFFTSLVTALLLATTLTRTMNGLDPLSVVTETAKAIPHNFHMEITQDGRVKVASPDLPLAIPLKAMYNGKPAADFLSVHFIEERSKLVSVMADGSLLYTLPEGKSFPFFIVYKGRVYDVFALEGTYRWATEPVTIGYSGALPYTMSDASLVPWELFCDPKHSAADATEFVCTKGSITKAADAFVEDFGPSIREMYSLFVWSVFGLVTGLVALVLFIGYAVYSLLMGFIVRGVFALANGWAQHLSPAECRSLVIHTLAPFIIAAHFLPWIGFSVPAIDNWVGFCATHLALMLTISITAARKEHDIARRVLRIPGANDLMGRGLPPFNNNNNRGAAAQQQPQPHEAQGHAHMHFHAMHIPTAAAAPQPDPRAQEQAVQAAYWQGYTAALQQVYQMQTDLYYRMAQSQAAQLQQQFMWQQPWDAAAISQGMTGSNAGDGGGGGGGGGSGVASAAMSGWPSSLLDPLPSSVAEMNNSSSFPLPADTNQAEDEGSQVDASEQPNEEKKEEA